MVKQGGLVMEELTCKDCNSPAHVSVVFCDGTYGSKIQYCVICSKCKADTDIPQRFDTPEEAIAAWNRRGEGERVRQYVS